MESVLFRVDVGVWWVGWPSQQEHVGLGGEGSVFRGLSTVGQGTIWS